MCQQGISFNDHYARGVLCVGIPYPNFGDGKIGSKRRFNDWKRNGGEPLEKFRGRGGPRSWPAICAAGDHDGRGGFAESGGAAAAAGKELLSGDEWYAQEAFRALNQVSFVVVFVYIRVVCVK